jgi:hypothetical protein
MGYILRALEHEATGLRRHPTSSDDILCNDEFGNASIMEDSLVGAT